MRILNTLPVRAKAFNVGKRYKASALTGRHLLTCFDPGCRFACPELGAVALSERALKGKVY